MRQSSRVGIDWLMFASVIQPRHRLAGDGCVAVVITLNRRCLSDVVQFHYENQSATRLITFKSSQNNWW